VPTEPGDVVNHATHALSQLSVPVIAAVNHHTPDADYETLSPWAEPSWVLSVGATDDALGTQEWSHSARGSANNPIGPDILAWGQDPFDPDGFGTSFAAPRVAYMVAIARAWLLQLAANLNRLAGRPYGVPLIGCAVIDRYFPKPPEPIQVDWAALPVIASDDDFLRFLVGARSPGQLADVLVGPVGMIASRSLVQKAAQATSPSVTPAMSAPSITLERLLGFLDEMPATTLLDLLALNAPLQETELVMARPIFESGTADRVRVLVEASEPIWEWDISTRTGRVREQLGRAS
jgi:subtilase family protein